VRTISAEDVRIPKEARDAVASHEEVLVLNRERPAFLIVNPEDYPRPGMAPRRGRPLHEVLSILEGGPLPDPGFADDLGAVLASVGPPPQSLWERSKTPHFSFTSSVRCGDVIPRLRAGT